MPLKKRDVIIAMSLDNVSQQLLETETTAHSNFVVDWMRVQAYVYASVRILVPELSDLKKLFLAELEKCKPNGSSDSLKHKLEQCMERFAHVFEFLGNEWKTQKTVAGLGGPAASTAAPIPTSTTPLGVLALKDVLDEVLRFHSAEYFRATVAPDTKMIHDNVEKGPWSKVIKQSTFPDQIRQQIDHGEIINLGQLRTNLLLMVGNSVMFNAPQADYAPAARTLALSIHHFFRRMCPEPQTAFEAELIQGSAPPTKKARR